MNATTRFHMGSQNPSIKVDILHGTSTGKDFEFDHEFVIGRGEDCQIQLNEDVVSRSHCRVFWDEDTWWVEDLQSSNGLYFQGEQKYKLPIKDLVTIRLGATGPMLRFMVQVPLEQPATTDSIADLDHYKSHYFTDEGGPAGEHTMMVRRAFAEVQKKQKRRYHCIIALAAILIVASLAYAGFRQMQLSKQKQLAADIFYKMKALDVQLTQLIKETEQHRSSKADDQIKKFKQHQKEMEDSYNQFTDTLNVYGKSLNEEEKLILKISRTFGECEITMPEEFMKKIKEYIEKWKESDRLKKAVQRAQRKGYIPTIAKTLTDHGLPPQFFYLALQESNLNVNAVGPPTRFGIAKGMWQFIPATANRYGLRPGPLVEKPKVDHKDDRHHFGRSTLAAARYLRDIYATDAQASGLLVMASYNWGEHRVIPLLQTMPPNPRERNFWQLLEKYRNKIPDQTYDYVFSIISAAVVGENPRLFGFDFDNPLAEF